MKRTACWRIAPLAFDGSLELPRLMLGVGRWGRGCIGASRGWARLRIGHLLEGITCNRQISPGVS